MNGLLLPVKGLTCTSASPQGDPQPHVHIHEPTRRSPAPRTHPRAHKGIARLARTCARPQGNPQTRAHMREPTRGSPDSRAHPRPTRKAAAHVHIREPRAYPRPSAQDCRARSALTHVAHVDNHSPAHRHPGTRPQPRIRGTQPRPRQLERGKKNTQRNSGRTPRGEYKKPDQKIRLKWWAILGSNQ